MWCKLVVLMGMTVLGRLDDPAMARADEFEVWFRSAREGDLEIPSSVALKARSFRYVFVGGFRNERMPGYFVQNMAELRALGIPRSRMHLINPSSRQDSEGNLEEVKARFLKIAAEGPEKLVVIAHSRGACDSLAFALGNASFVKDRVEALFLIQGPFGGSGVAEYLVGDGPAMDRRMPVRHRLIAHWLGQLALAAVRKSGSEAVDGMTREASRALWARLLDQHGEAVAIVSPKTFYIRSVIHPSQLRFARRAVAWYVQIYHGRGDGLVALEDQTLPGIGRVLATLEAGHADLTQKYPATRTPRSLRRALARALFMAVGQPSRDSGSTEQNASVSDAGSRLDTVENSIPKRLPGFKSLRRRKPGDVPVSRVIPADR